MWSVIAGFLKDHHMEAAVDCGKDLWGFSACRAWDLLEHKEAVLVVNEVPDRVGEWDVKGRLGFTKTCHWKHNGRGLGKGSVPCAVGVVDAGWCSRLGGTGSLHLWFGLWSSLGGGRNEVVRLRVRGTIKDGGRGMPRKPGQCMVWCQGDVPDRSVLVVAGHKCSLGMEVEWPSRGWWFEGLPSRMHYPSGLLLERYACDGLCGEARARLCQQQVVTSECWRAGLSPDSHGTVAMRVPGCFCNRQWRLVVRVLNSAG